MTAAPATFTPGSATPGLVMSSVMALPFISIRAPMRRRIRMLPPLPAGHATGTGSPPALSFGPNQQHDRHHDHDEQRERPRAGQLLVMVPMRRSRGRCGGGSNTEGTM